MEQCRGALRELAKTRRKGRGVPRTRPRRAGSALRYRECERTATNERTLIAFHLDHEIGELFGAVQENLMRDARRNVDNVAGGKLLAGAALN